MLGAGKYDPIAQRALVDAGVNVQAGGGVLLIVFNGKHGSGFACAATPEVVLRLPSILRSTADNIERDQVHVRDVDQALRTMRQPGEN